MAAISGNGIVGRKIKFYQGDVSTGVLFSARTKTFSLGSEPIDVTDDSDDGYRTLLSDPAQKQIDMTVEGVLRQDDFVERFLDPTSGDPYIDEYTLVIPGIGTIVGDFAIGSFELGAPYNEATTFTASIQSSGVWTFTADTGS